MDNKKVKVRTHIRGSRKQNPSKISRLDQVAPKLIKSHERNKPKKRR